jgi:hypothetical protein
MVGANVVTANINHETMIAPAEWKVTSFRLGANTDEAMQGR